MLEAPDITLNVYTDTHHVWVCEYSEDVLTRLEDALDALSGTITAEPRDTRVALTLVGGARHVIMASAVTEYTVESRDNRRRGESILRALSEEGSSEVMTDAAAR